MVLPYLASLHSQIHMHAQTQQTRQIVIADDNPRALRGLCAILAAQPGITIIGKASQGAEALDLVENLHPQVVVLDVSMPVMDGLQAARSIKKNWPQTRVILLSICGDHRNQAFETGADGFLVKGCPAVELIATILGPTSGSTERAGFQWTNNKNNTDHCVEDLADCSISQETARQSNVYGS